MFFKSIINIYEFIRGVEMQSILIVEDNNDINNLICDALSKNGYTCMQAFSGTEGLMHIKNKEFSLVLLDLMLPGMGGEELLKKIKPQYKTPVIIISAKDELDSKVDLLGCGADDYITKPFEIKELIARVGVAIRHNSTDISMQILSYKDLNLNKTTFQCLLNNEEISLTKQEFKILELLMTYQNKVFSKQDIYDYAWGDFYIGEDKTINVHISNIRQKFKKITDTEYIETVWGIGFKLSK